VALQWSHGVTAAFSQIGSILGIIVSACGWKIAYRHCNFSVVVFITAGTVVLYFLSGIVGIRSMSAELNWNYLPGLVKAEFIIEVIQSLCWILAMNSMLPQPSASSNNNVDQEAPVENGNSDLSHPNKRKIIFIVSLHCFCLILFIIIMGLAAKGKAGIYLHNGGIFKSSNAAAGMAITGSVVGIIFSLRNIRQPFTTNFIVMALVQFFIAGAAGIWSTQTTNLPQITTAELTFEIIASFCWMVLIILKVQIPRVQENQLVDHCIQTNIEK